MKTLKKCLTGANIDMSRVDVVVLVGGSTRILDVRRLLRDLFDKKELHGTSTLTRRSLVALLS